MSIKIKITAQSVEEFTSINDKLETLDPVVHSQIISAEKSAYGVKCVIESKDSKTIYLPKDIDSIIHYDDSISICCHNISVVFVVNIDKNFKINYTFNMRK